LYAHKAYEGSSHDAMVPAISYHNCLTLIQLEDDLIATDDEFVEKVLKKKLIVTSKGKNTKGKTDKRKKGVTKDMESNKNEEYPRFVLPLSVSKPAPTKNLKVKLKLSKKKEEVLLESTVKVAEEKKEAEAVEKKGDEEFYEVNLSEDEKMLESPVKVNLDTNLEDPSEQLSIIPTNDNWEKQSFFQESWVESALMLTDDPAHVKNAEVYILVLF